MSKIVINEELTLTFLFLFKLESVINLQDEEGFTPLMWAAAHGQIAVVEFLLQSVSATYCTLSLLQSYV